VHSKSNLKEQRAKMESPAGMKSEMFPKRQKSGNCRFFDSKSELCSLFFVL
jgi:hypothetical protein